MIMSKLSKELHINGGYVSVRGWIINYAVSAVKLSNILPEDALVEALDELDSGWSVDAELTHDEEAELLEAINEVIKS